MLNTNALNYAINIGWLSISFINNNNNKVFLSNSIFINKIVWLYITKMSCYINKQLFILLIVDLVMEI